MAIRYPFVMARYPDLLISAREVRSSGVCALTDAPYNQTLFSEGKRST